VVRSAPPVAPPGEELARRTLRALIERLHPAVLDVLVAPAGLDREVGDPVILDPVEETLPPAHSVVLAVGVDTPRAQAALLDRLVDAHVSAVVLKHADALNDAVTDMAHAAGIAVLSAPTALSWGQLYSFVVTATSARPIDAPDEPEAPLGDLFALANAVAAMVGGATTIEDPANRVLAYSNLDFPIDPPRQQTILGRAVPGEWIRRLQDAGVFRRLWQSDDVVRVEDFSGDPDYLPRLAVAVRAGGELLGSIWVIEGTQPLGAEAERTLREAADIAALHLLRHRSAGDVDRHRRAEALVRLLDGLDRGDQARSVLGLDPGQLVTVVAFDVGPGSDAAAIMAARRVADLVAVYCESYRRQAACAASGSRVYALLPTDPGAAGEPAAELARAIVDRAGQALRAPLRAAIGSTVGGLDAVDRSRREADEVLDVLGPEADAAVASIDAMRARVVVHRLRRLVAEHPELNQGKVVLLAEQDAAKGTAWIPTLRAYFDAFGDMAEAAARVTVHPNTFRYRLRRISELFDLDLSDPDERLVAELQLRFIEP
jgi:hypothetical protein